LRYNDRPGAFVDHRETARYYVINIYTHPHNIIYIVTCVRAFNACEFIITKCVPYILFIQITHERAAGVNRVFLINGLLSRQPDVSFCFVRSGGGVITAAARTGLESEIKARPVVVFYSRRASCICMYYKIIYNMTYITTTTKRTCIYIYIYMYIGVYTWYGQWAN